MCFTLENVEFCVYNWFGNENRRIVFVLLKKMLSFVFAKLLVKENRRKIINRKLNNNLYFTTEITEFRVYQIVRK